MSRSWTIQLPAPARWINANARRGWRPNEAIAAWRGLAAANARAAKLPKLGVCHLTAELRWCNNIRRDTPNFYPTIKAAIDGLVDAEVLDDDDDLHVRSLTIQRGPNVPKPKLGVGGVLILTVREAS